MSFDTFDIAGELSEDLRMIMDTVRDAAATRLAPLSKTIDEKKEIPADVAAMLGELGLFGITAPESVGGTAMEFTAAALVTAELAAADTSAALSFALPVVRVLEAVAGARSESVRAAAKSVAAGESSAAFVDDDHVKSVDETAHALKIEAHGAGYLLNGRVRDVAAASNSDYFLVAPTIGPWFFLPASTEGVVVGPPKRRLGIGGVSASDLSFTNVKVSAEQLAVAESESAAMRARIGARWDVAIAAAAEGLMRRIKTDAIAYAKERRQFGRPIADFEAMREKIADIECRLAGARSLWLSAARLIARGGDAAILAKSARLFSVTGAVKAADDAIQIHGGYGFSAEYAVERYYRDAATLSAMGGGTDLLRIDIAAYALA